MTNKCPILIIIPAYNEEETIEELLNRLRAYPVADICVVNDCSKDSTALILSKFTDIHVINHEKNTHIPGAIIDGMKYALEKKYDYVITMDAGLSHLPEELPLFINCKHCDLVIGTRVKKMNTPLFRKVLSFAGNIVYNVSLDFPKTLFKKKYYKDLTSGYRRYSKKAIEVLLSCKINSKSFDFLIESATYIYQNNLSFCEVPITYNFSNSSLNSKVVKNCISMCINLMFNKARKEN